MKLGTCGSGVWSPFERALFVGCHGSAGSSGGWFGRQNSLRGDQNML